MTPPRNDLWRSEQSTPPPVQDFFLSIETYHAQKGETTTTIATIANEKKLQRLGEAQQFEIYVVKPYSQAKETLGRTAVGEETLQPLCEKVNQELTDLLTRLETTAQDLYNILLDFGGADEGLGEFLRIRTEQADNNSGAPAHPTAPGMRPIGQ